MVDDRPDTLAGRVLWLQSVDGAQVEGLSFSQALAADWDGVELAVLDGRDDRVHAIITITDGERSQISFDRFLGPRVAECIRRGRNRDQTRIVLVSAYARDNEVLARRCFEVGVDYLYDVHELQSAEAFMAAVFEPDCEPLSARALPLSQWQQLGLAAAPKLTQAIAAVEASPAGEQLLFDEPAADHPGQAHFLRTLRERLGPLLAIPPEGGGPRTRHASKRVTSAWLRRAMGLNEET